jgi:aryl-alcohol dehydrogenase-like predicted oxidoreductase
VVSAPSTAQFAAESARLGVDRIDLVQVRVLDPAEDVAGGLAALSELRRTGRVRWIGLSRVTSPSAIAAAGDGMNLSRPNPDGARIDLLQNRLSMVRRSEHGPGLVRFCQLQRIALNPCQVLERGQLCEVTAAPADRSPTDIRRSAPAYNGAGHQAVRRWVLSRLVPLAHAHGLSAEQLSIGWVLAQPGVAFCVVGASRPEQVRRAVAMPRPLPADVLASVDSALADLCRA